MMKAKREPGLQIAPRGLLGMDVIVKGYENVICSVDDMQKKARGWHKDLEAISGYEALLVADMGGGKYISITILDNSGQRARGVYDDPDSRHAKSPFDRFKSFEAEGSLIYQRGL